MFHFLSFESFPGPSQAFLLCLKVVLCYHFVWKHMSLFKNVCQLMPVVYPEMSSWSDSSFYESQRLWPFLMQWKQKHKGGLSELTRSSGAWVHCDHSQPCILHTVSIAAFSLYGNFAQIRCLEGLRLTSNELVTSTHNSLARIRHMASPNHKVVRQCSHLSCS